MIWLFEREDESLRIETRYDNETSEFVAIVHYPDGRQVTKRFHEPDVYGRWLERFERSLEEGNWARNESGPVILPDGWPNRRPT
jgi:hypothetical protein